MAKKQAFGADAAKMKQSHKKMAKVVVAFKNQEGRYNYRSTMVSQETVGDYLKNVKS